MNYVHCNLAWLIGLWCCLLSQAEAEQAVVTDVSRLQATPVTEIVHVQQEADVLQAISRAKSHDRTIAITATHHSQGGHNADPNAIVLDMSSYKRIVAFEPQQKTIRVQAGITWAEIQQHINSYGLSIAVMQSSNIFSVGGALSANIHGRDPNYGPIVETVRALRLALADGRVLEVDRKHHAELFYSAIGGYGLIGVILEAELELSDNLRLQKQVSTRDYHDYVAHLQHQLMTGRLKLHYGRLSIVHDETLLRECVAVDYLGDGHYATVPPLNTEDNIWLYRTLFGWSRSSDWGKSLRWWMQAELLDQPDSFETISRNNAMRPAIQFLHYEDEADTDILQEYFIPSSQLVTFIDRLRDIVIDDNINLLNVTLRYTPHREAVTLDYANSDTIAVVLYINIPRSEEGVAHARQWTRKLVDAALAADGNYYLTYQGYPSREQFQRAYPQWRDFMSIKQQVDPDGLFANHFYRQYLLE